MEIENANTEPFFRFHRFHEAFNRNIKVAFGALQALQHSATVQNEVAAGTRLPTGGEPWGHETVWRDVSTVARPSMRFLSEMGLVRAMSAFEDFIIGVEAEYSRTSFLRAPDSEPTTKGESTCAASDPTLRQVFRRCGWDIGSIRSVVPLLDYFSIARNCIVHQSNRANRDLVERAQAQDLVDCHASWPTRAGTTLPKLPTVNLNREVYWLPRHAILASAVCYAAVECINRKLVETLGDEGLVYMAAHHSLLSDERIPTNGKKSPEIVIRSALVGRYRVKRVSIAEITGPLRRIGRWRACRHAYGRAMAA